MAVVKIPHNWEPDKHQLPVLKSKAIFKVLKWHRRARKTTLAVNELIRWAYGQRGVYAYVAPLRDQAKKIVWDGPDMLAKYLPPQQWETRNSSELKVTFPNGSILYVLGADNPDSLRGLDFRGIVFDEWDDMKEEVWDVIRPILAANGGWAWFAGTPKGTGNLKRKIAYVEQNPDDQKWASFTLRASESHIIPQDELDDMKRSMPAAMYAQELEVEDVDNAASVFRRVTENTYDATGISPDYSRRYQLGLDLGKHMDWTVMTPLDLNALKAYPQVRFNQIDWPLQKARITTEYLRYGTPNSRPRVVMDATGLGDPIADDLDAGGVKRLERFVFSERSRNELLSHLAVLLEQDRLKIPNDSGLVSELKSFRYVLRGRKVRMEAPEGLHDDRVMSLALACYEVDLPQPLDAIDAREVYEVEGFDPYAVV